MRRAAKTASVLLLLALLAAASYGCVWVGELLYSLDPDPTEAPVTEPPFGVSDPSSAPAEAASSDPVAAACDFASGVIRLWGESSAGFTEAVCENGEAADTYLLLMGDWSAFASVYSVLRAASSGTLLEEEGIPYAAAHKVGKNGELTVEAENGASLTCSLVAGNVLNCSFVRADARLELTAAKSGAGYIIRLNGAPNSFIEVRPGRIRYARSEKASGLVFPEEETALDYVGGRLG